MKISDVLLRLVGGRDPSCPNEADILAYSESRLPEHRRLQSERHFAGCDDCRELLAFLGRESDDLTGPISEESVSEQTRSVLAYIQKDERNRSKSAQKARAAGGFYVSYPKLASAGAAISAIAIACFLIPWGPSPADDAMKALRIANKDGRRIEARVSGGFDHSDYVRRATRGNDVGNDDLHFSNAENKVKAAGKETAAVDDRLVLARSYLLRGAREYTKRALEILSQLEARGVETPEALNDMGVARLQLDNYNDAIDYFTKALAKSPGYDEALFNKALAEEGARWYDDAKRDWRRFIDQSADDSWKSEARKRLGSLGGASDR